jgi:hypothetical protein
LDIYIGILLGAHPILHISRIRVKNLWSEGKMRDDFIVTGVASIHCIVCLTTGPQPLPIRVLHTL